MYYLFKKFINNYKIIKKFPLYTKIKKTSLRIEVDKNVENIVVKKTENFLKNKNFKQILNCFDKKHISLFFFYYFYEKIYAKVAVYNINKLYKRKNNSFFFNYELIDFFYSINVFIKIIIYLFKSKFFFDNSNKFTKANIVIKYTYGNSKISRNDFPYLNHLKKINNKIKYKFFFYGTNKLINKNFNYSANYICKNKNENLRYNPINISGHTKKFKSVLKFSLLNFFKNPLIYTLLMDFAYEYDYFYKLFKHLGTKVYINSLFDRNQAPSRQALNELNAKSVAFNRSYLGSNASSFLSISGDVVFNWGKNNILKRKSNFIDKIINIYPSFLLGKHKIKNNNKVITVFDSSFDEGSHLSPNLYNEFLNLILKECFVKNNIFIILKLKYLSNKKYIEKNNENLISKLVIKKKIKIISNTLESNADLICRSDLILSINSITCSAEALINKVDTLCLCNQTFEKRFVNKVNHIHPFLCYDIKNFKKFLKYKLKFKNSNNSLNKINKFLFDRKFLKNKPEIYINNLLQ
jgi:hypothetical protein